MVRAIASAAVGIWQAVLNPKKISPTATGGTFVVSRKMAQAALKSIVNRGKINEITFNSHSLDPRRSCKG